MPHILHRLMHLEIRSTLARVVRRYPVSLVIVAIVCALWFMMIHHDGNTPLWAAQGVTTGVILFFLATAASLLCERGGLTGWKVWGIWIFLGVFGYGLYQSVDGIYGGDIRAVITTWLGVSGSIAALYVAPFLGDMLRGKSENPIHFANYFTQVSWAFLMSMVVGGMSLVLGWIALWTVITLFDLREDSETFRSFADWAVITLSCIAPIYGLASLPRPQSYETPTYTQNTFFSLLIRYIATPFIWVYFLILYAYSIRVLMHFSDWPKGVIVWMVIGFSVFGYLVYILSRPYTDTSRIVAVFRRFFPLIVLPQLGMLGYAIWLRVAQYDLTIHRYFVVVFGLWLLGVSLYLVISRRKELSMIPASLMCSILIISVGPWSVYSYPQTRQEARLMRNLEAAHILRGGRIVPLVLSTSISADLHNEIYAGMTYLCDYDECRTLERIFPDQYAAVLSKPRFDIPEDMPQPTPDPSPWTIISEIADLIGVAPRNNSSSPTSRYITFGTPYQGSSPVRVTGYDYLVHIAGQKGDGFDSTERLPNITLDIEKSAATYTHTDNRTETYHLPDIPALQGHPGGEVPISSLTFSVTGSLADIEFHFQNYAIKNPAYIGNSDADQTYYTFDGVALVKLKK